MFDTFESVCYRIPGQKPVRKHGRFYKLNEGDVVEGFVVTDFEGSNQYLFKDDEEEFMPQFHLPPRLEETSKLSYLKSAKKIRDSLKSLGGKAVLSRIKKVELDEAPGELFNDLCEAYPNAFVYEFFHAQLGRWIGATPETLVKANQGKGQTMALAGTRVTHSEMPWTEKEFEEHEYVADFIEETLREAGIANVNRGTRTNLQSGPVEHLMTRFDFDLSVENVWELALQLHPTPAVSGWPVKEAIELIRKYEHHDRLFYTGIIGVVGERTDLFVNLRCARNDLDNLFLFLGGGFTKDSDPESEWIETENKAKTLLNVLKKH